MAEAASPKGAVSSLSRADRIASPAAAVMPTSWAAMGQAQALAIEAGAEVCAGSSARID
jgi:hypothetical protein